MVHSVSLMKQFLSNTPAVLMGCSVEQLVLEVILSGQIDEVVGAMEDACNRSVSSCDRHQWRPRWRRKRFDSTALADRNLVTTLGGRREHYRSALWFQCLRMVQNVVNWGKMTRRTAMNWADCQESWTSQEFKCWWCKLEQEEILCSRIQKKRLTWFGHVERMESSRLPYRAIHCYREGNRSWGGPRKTWFKNENIEHQNGSGISQIQIQMDDSQTNPLSA
jgi:hypothetical protein